MVVHKSSDTAISKEMLLHDEWIHPLDNGADGYSVTDEMVEVPGT